MTPERIAEIKSRLGELPQGAWRTRWEGQSFCVEDAEGTEVMEYVFAIPTWEPEYEAAKATCDVAVPTFVAHARQDVPDLCDALAAAQERIAELEAALERVSRWHHSGIVHMSATRPLAPFELVPIEECRREPCVIARAALAVSQGGGGGEEVAPASATDDEPWCTVDRHIVLPSGEACVCGENRMELML